MLCQTVGILPAVPGDQIITFSPNRCFTVEITQQKCHLFSGCCTGHLFPLIEKRLFFILPPAHVYRIVPDISCTDTKCTTRFPVMIIVCPAQQQIFCCSDWHTTENCHTFIILVVADFCRKPAPVIMYALFL